MPKRSTATRRKERLHEAKNRIAQLEEEVDKLRAQLRAKDTLIERLKTAAQDILNINQY